MVKLFNKFLHPFYCNRSIDYSDEKADYENGRHGDGCVQSMHQR